MKITGSVVIQAPGRDPITYKIDVDVAPSDKDWDEVRDIALRAAHILADRES